MNKKSIKSRIIFFALTLCICLTTLYGTALADEQIDTVKVIDDGVISTYLNDGDELDPLKFCSENNINIKESDKLDLSKFSDQNTIIIHRGKVVYINDMKTIQPHTVYSLTIDDVFEEVGLDRKQYTVFTDKSEKISDGLVIEIAQNIEITLKYDGKVKHLKAYYGESFSKLLKDQNIRITDEDSINFDVNDTITKKQTIEIKKATITEKTTKEKVPYTTEVKYNSSVPAGEKKVIQSGSDGSKKVTRKYSEFYDSKKPEEVSVKEEEIEEPTTEIIEIGTKISDTKKKYNDISVGDVIKGIKTHYCACDLCGSGSGVTASGLRVKNGMKNPYIIACNWLPMGAVVEIDDKVYTVADRGGSGFNSIGRVDIFTPEGHEACYQKGKGACTIKILSL